MVTTWWRKLSISVELWENGLGVRAERRHVRSPSWELGMEILRWVLNSPRNIALLLHGLCTWPRIDWICEWRQLSSPDRWQFWERVTTNASNVSHDICMVTQTICNGTYFRKTRIQQSWARMLFGPNAKNHVHRIQEGLCSSGIISSARGVVFRHALHWVQVKQSWNSGFVHLMREFKTDDWCRIVHRVDASACLAITLRRGCGGVKHITVKA